jgi:phosphomannomutase
MRLAGNPVLLDIGRRCAVVGSGTAAAAVAVPPDPSRPVLVLAGGTVLACLAAAFLRWRLPGSLAVVVTTAAVLLAGALDDDSRLRPLQTLVGAAFVVALVAALGAREEAGAGSAGTVVVARAPWRRRVGVPLLALAAGAVVAVTAAQDVVPSVPLVLAGLAAAVTALVVTAGVHRT